MERRRRGQPRKTIPEPTITSPFLQLSKMPDFTAPPSAEETPGQGTLAGPEMERRRRGRPPKIIPEPTIASPFQQGLTGLERVDDEAGLLEKTRKDLVNARVRFEDDRWLQKLRDSDLRAWCKPVRDLQLETVQSFYIHTSLALASHHFPSRGTWTMSWKLRKNSALRRSSRYLDCQSIYYVNLVVSTTPKTEPWEGMTGKPPKDRNMFVLQC
jgi:hypothetical protein